MSDHPHLPHPPRSMIIAGVGVLLAIASLTTVMLLVRSVGPKGLSLAYRIDPTRTLSFVRTTERETFVRTIALITPPEAIPTLPNSRALPEGVSYEFALAQSGGTLTWAIYVHMKNQRHTTLVSRKDSHFFLPLKEVGASLGAMPFFRNAPQNASNVVYLNLRTFHLSSTLLQAALTPFSAVLMTGNIARMTVTLEKRAPTLFTETRPLLSSPTQTGSSLLTMTSSDPNTIMTSLALSLAARDPSLAEGLQGILKERLQRIIGQSDLLRIGRDFFSEGTSMVVVPAGSGTALLLSGQATRERLLVDWVSALRGITTSSRIRTHIFSSENRRIDVLSAPLLQEDPSIRDWRITTFGASGSRLHLIIATKGHRFMLSTDPVLLREGIERMHHLSTLQGVGPRSLEGAADVTWLLHTVESNLPFLSDHISWVKQWLDDEHIRTMHWSGVDSAERVTIMWKAEG